ncbi:cytochrome P450 [Suillus subalutaceus]|uniref:cytochrome P450 n=1 Tax=Suillus subalutaceus TaxID=48586 RepID=UPI001B8768CC|nr:cytochrome P450 [Suillus subalutaceus]KAG1854466.1 cytochrome P450 [Suillus subalutaceus]
MVQGVVTTISKPDRFNGVYHCCMHPYCLGQRLDREATISGHKAVVITAWTAWTLAFGNTMPESYGAVSIREVDRTILDPCSRSNKAIGFSHEVGLVIGCGGYHGKRGSKSRMTAQRSIAVQETLSGGMRMLLEGSGDRLRRLRRVLHAGLQPRVAETYEPIQARNSKNLVLDILNDPKNHQRHAMRYAASVVMSFTYGKTTPTSYTDPEIVAVHKSLARLGQAVKPGAYLVDTHGTKKILPLFNGQLDVVRRQMVCDFAVLTDVLAHPKQYQLEDKELAYIAGGMFSAGSDSTASAITVMMMAATIHTDAQARVQEELDNVVGLPTFGDQEMLPQVTAFILESMRWRPVSLGGFPHCATKDIIWNNYLIPAGAIVIGNHWAIANDPEVFPEPHKFNPQRWIDDAGRVRDDLRFFTFGFGRRVCPGQHVANRSIFINTALILWAFRLSENPAAKIDTLAFSDAATIHAAPFEICFEKRIDENLIRELCAPGE